MTKDPADLPSLPLRSILIDGANGGRICIAPSFSSLIATYVEQVNELRPDPPIDTSSAGWVMKSGHKKEE